MDCFVIVRPEGDRGFSAQAVALPEVRVVAATEAEAIERVGESLS